MSSSEGNSYFVLELFRGFREFKQLINNEENTKAILPILIPQSAYVSHWVSVIFEDINGVIKVTYLDSENQPMPLGLTNALVSEIKNHDVVLYQPLLETQRYNNCGPELIENFVYYLTGTRATQEAAVYLHSLLHENSLLNPEFAAPQIAENNRLIDDLSNQMRPFYHTPSWDKYKVDSFMLENSATIVITTNSMITSILEQRSKELTIVQETFTAKDQDAGISTIGVIHDSILLTRNQT